MSDTRLQTSLDQVLSIPSVRAEHPNLHAGATDELATLRAQLAEAREVIKPFIHEDLCSQLAGNTIGEKSIVFGRDKAELTLGDFRAARAWYNKVTTAQAVYTSGTPT